VKRGATYVRLYLSERVCKPIMLHGFLVTSA